jgi:hypothetical protein
MEPRTRTNRRDIVKEPIRETVREPVRANGKKEVIGRDGKVLSRKRGTNIDRFYVPKEAIPEGWDYEWKAQNIMGQENTAHMMSMSENGWTPVPASRHPGLFMPQGYEGPILRDNMILMERPIELTEEARAEDVAAANALMNHQRQQLGQRLPSGFSGDHAGVRPRVNRSYEPSDVNRPQLRIED